MLWVAAVTRADYHTAVLRAVVLRSYCVFACPPQHTRQSGRPHVELQRRGISRRQRSRAPKPGWLEGLLKGLRASHCVSVLRTSLCMAWGDLEPCTCRCKIAVAAVFVTNTRFALSRRLMPCAQSQIIADS